MKDDTYFDLNSSLNFACEDCCFASLTSRNLDINAHVLRKLVLYIHNKKLGLLLTLWHENLDFFN